jgi:hypothetical protein
MRAGEYWWDRGRGNYRTSLHLFSLRIRFHQPMRRCTTYWSDQYTNVSLFLRIILYVFFTTTVRMPQIHAQVIVTQAMEIAEAFSEI